MTNDLLDREIVAADFYAAIDLHKDDIAFRFGFGVDASEADVMLSWTSNNKAAAASSARPMAIIIAEVATALGMPFLEQAPCKREWHRDRVAGTWSSIIAWDMNVFEAAIRSRHAVG